jgi:hypothetical protein
MTNSSSWLRIVFCLSPCFFPQVNPPGAPPQPAQAVHRTVAQLQTLLGLQPAAHALPPAATEQETPLFFQKVGFLLAPELLQPATLAALTNQEETEEEKDLRRTLAEYLDATVASVREDSFDKYVYFHLLSLSPPPHLVMSF